jgi:GMP synthase (glutamine-hydrolysing)
VVSSVLIVKAGTTVPSVFLRRKDYETWIAAAMGLADSEVTVCPVYEDAPLPDPGEVSAVVVTGSAAMVTDRAPWSERAAEWLRAAVSARTPVLAICYGHQLLAHAFDGTVEHNPRGRQIGTIDVTLTPEAATDPLFSGFESVLHVPVSHLQSVTKLPQQARLLATSARDPHHAFALGENAWGVQFHPEFDADIVRGYIAERRDKIAAEGLDPDALSAGAADTLHGTLLLRRFAELARVHGL